MSLPDPHSTSLGAEVTTAPGGTPLRHPASLSGTVDPALRDDLGAVPLYKPGTSRPSALSVASNETSQRPLPEVVAAAMRATEDANRYPETLSTALRQELLTHLAAEAKEQGAPAPTLEQLAIGAGSVALCQQLVLATCRSGSARDEVVIPWRSFEAYPIIALIAGAQDVRVPLTPEHRHDLPAMLEAITDRTGLIFLCNPNNPSGTTMSHDDVADFLEHVPPHIVVALDEAYIHFDRSPDRPRYFELAERHPNLVALRTFSKAYGLAGLRVGYLLGDPRIIEVAVKVSVPFAVNVAAQAAALEALRHEDSIRQRVDAVVAQRGPFTERLREALAQAGARVADEPLTLDDAAAVQRLLPDSQGNFVWIACGDVALPLTEALAECDVIVRGFAGEGVRITVTTPEEGDRILEALGEVLPQLYATH